MLRESTPNAFDMSTLEPVGGLDIGREHNGPGSTDLLHDVFSDSPPPSPSLTATGTLQSQDPSDIPRLRTTHTTAGYRDGIAVSKTTSLQPGFDEGYSLGAVLGLRVGYIIGVLEALYAALSATEKQRIGKMLNEARDELSVEKVFARGNWGEDGVWVYEVAGKEEEVTFEEVADAHPVLKNWTSRVKEEMDKFGVDEGRFQGEEWERGRIDSERMGEWER
ncbi:MAG: hypothetical protein LQ347_006060 [Umbilicaria vellea]|nr:MAG: hypothetical protein LQ347_006060 [Umbilicaria vellea]